MTRREKFLTGTLVAVILCVGAVMGSNALVDELQRRQSEWVDLQRLAIQIQTTASQESARDSTEGRSLSEWEGLFWDEGSLPGPLALAQQLKPLLEDSGLETREFRVIEATATESALVYSLKGSMDAFLGVFIRSRVVAPRLLVRRLSVALEEGGQYRIEWEVAYAVAP